MKVDVARLFRLQGKVAIVTGGSRGIGAMAASALTAAGVTVYLVGRDEAALGEVAAGIGPQIIPIAGDLRDMAVIEHVTATVTGNGRGLDFLINNAGSSWAAPLGSFPPDRFNSVMDVNLGVPFRLIESVLPLLRAAASAEAPARIVNIASVDGMEPPAWESYPYAASKAAMLMLTRHLAGTLASANITVNAISPGIFPSKMTGFLFKRSSAEELGKSVPLGRVGGEDDIGGALIYLLSRAGRWVTGINLPVAGGLATTHPGLPP